MFNFDAKQRVTAKIAQKRVTAFGRYLKPGSVGRVLGRRIDDGQPVYLVKFTGHSWPMYIEQTELAAA